jgi:hypothetical protein
VSHTALFILDNRTIFLLVLSPNSTKRDKPKNIHFRGQQTINNKNKW